MKSIGTRIKELRKAECLTQKDFSNRLLISQSYLSGLENGNETPTNKLLKLICLEFGVDEKWISDGVGEMYSKYYENDKSMLVDVSNNALLRIMLLLSTKSNTEYGFYAYLLSAFSSLLEISNMQNEEIKIEFLEKLQCLIFDLERLFQQAIDTNDEIKLNENEHSLFSDMDNILSLLKKSN